jgi:hypothetical protein
MSPSASTVVEVKWLVRTLSLGGKVIQVARLRIDMLLPLVQLSAPRIAQGAWLDTGAPLSVVPWHVQQRGIGWQPDGSVQTTWMGQPSAMGHMDVWLADRSSGGLCGPFVLRAKFPFADPPGLPFPILIGLEFMLTHGVSFSLDPPPGSGVLRFP